MKSRFPTRRKAGFTLIEVAIAASILALLLASVGTFQAISQKASRTMVVRSDLERRADRALQTITRALRGAGVHTLIPDPTSAFGSDTITFQTPTGVSGAGVVSFSAPSRIALALDTGEADNGVDDDGDGRVDERALVITRDVGLASQTATTTCHGIGEWLEGETSNGLDDNGNGVIDERGFNVRRVGDLLYVRLTLESRTEDGQVLRCTTDTALVLHN